MASPVFAQSAPSDPAFAGVPFERWMSEGFHREFPWKTHINSPELSMHQRLLVSVEIQVPIEEAVKRRGRGSLAALVQLVDVQGSVYRQHGSLELKDVDPKARKATLVFAWHAFVLPGTYDVALALYDNATGEHNFARRSLRVNPLKGDPLPEAWSELPRVEFFQAEEGLDEFFRPEIQGRLHLPLKGQRGLRIELLLNLTPSASALHSAAAYRRNLGILLPLLKALGQIEVRNGSLNAAALDLTRRRVSFEQNNLGDLDWPRLKAAVAAGDPGVVDVRDLRERKASAAFLRKELARRIEASGATPEMPDAEPLRVFILISRPAAFDEGTDLSPIESPGKCNCLVYYLRFLIFPPSEPGRERVILSTWPDAIEGILKRLKPRIFTLDSPESMRKAIAALLREISLM